MRRLKYVSTAIVFQEVPDEVSLAFNISGCPHHCEGCHSEYLWEYSGDYLLDNMMGEIEKYKDYITCVCFMGGDQNLDELSEAAWIVKKEYGLKVCIYSGLDSITDFAYEDLLSNTDYLKLGSFRPECGGLDSPNTNQRFYMLTQEPGDGTICENITEKFQKVKE